jgi:hypothetical protein
MTPHRTLIPALALLAGIPASAQTPVRVLHQDLRLDRFHLLAIDDAGVQLRDDDERTARVPLTALIALSAGGPDTLPAVPGEPSGMRVFVELVDAQRLVVDMTDSDDPESIAGVAMGLGACRIPLERITRIARPGAAWRTDTPTDDVVLLTNGDRLSGFVASIGTEVAIESADGAIARVPFARVREIRLANPPSAPGDAHAPLVTDDLGITLRARSFSVDLSGQPRLMIGPGPLGLDSRGEELVTYDRPSARLMGVRHAPETSMLALNTVTPERITPTGDRRWTPDPVARPDTDPVLPLGDIHMPAPAEATYPVAPGATRFACTVRAARPGTWTDCIARVHAVSASGTRTLLAEHRLTRAIASAEITADLPANTRAIVLEVDPGAHGAVQDAVDFIAPRVSAGK